MKQFVVIGCGRFGSSLAKTLFDLGYDVMVIDKNPEKIQDISPYVTHAVQADALDETTLKAIGIGNFDVAAVALGTNLEASIMTTLIVKELGVGMVIAKAQNENHGKVLEKLGADRVVHPERDMGVRIARNLVSSNLLDYIEFAPDYGIVEISALKEWEGKTLSELQLPTRYGINVIAIKHTDSINISPAADEVIGADDILVVIGNNQELIQLEREGQRD